MQTAVNLLIERRQKLRQREDEQYNIMETHRSKLESLEKALATTLSEITDINSLLNNAGVDLVAINT